MDSPVPHTVTVRGKDLPGAVMVMPLGLDAAIKKRVSGEFKSEKSGNSLTFGTVSGGHGGPGVSQESFQQKQSSQFSQMTSSSGGGGMSAANKMSSSMMSSNQQKSFQQTSMSSSSSFEKSSFSSSQQKKTNRVSGGFQDFSVHGEEIRQAKLKDQLHSAMSDLESEISHEYKENVPSNVMKSPTPSKGPHQDAFSPTPPSKHEYFSPPPLEPVPQPEPVSVASPAPVSFSPAPQKQPTPVMAAPFSMSPEPMRNQQQPPEPVSVAAPFSLSPEPARPAPQPEMVAAPFSMEPVRNQMASSTMQNGFSDFGQSVTDFGSSYKSESSFMNSQQQETSFMSSQKQESSFMSSQKQESSFMGSQQQENYSASKQESFSSSSTLNRGLEVESAGGQLQESDSNSSLLQKIMTPASNDYDSSSLKRRDPRKMFTDSSFYSSKHHPTVADQVEMAHRLTSALFKEDNKNSKGQQMYLNRMKKSGEESDMEDNCMPKRDAVPNMKLVMNPEGKVHEWNDMDPNEMPNAALLAGHAAPSLPSPEIINPVIEDMNSNTGRGGELFAKRRKRAENWVVDENNSSKTKPSAFADNFIQEQELQQQQFKQQQALEQAAQSAEEREYLAQQHQKLQQEKQQAQQQFRSQQQLKQEQSLEFRRQQEEAMMCSEQQELPPNFKRTDLKIRSFTPSLDLSIHNVQGINVWANTAPRGWGAQKGAKKGGLPTVSVSPATPSVDQQQIIIQQQREEQLRFEQEQKLEMARQEQMLLEQQMEKQRIEDQKMMEEQLRIEEEQRLEEERRMEEQRRFEQERQMEEQRKFEEEQRRAEQQRMEEQRRIEEQRMEEQRMEQQRMEEQRMEQQRMEQQRMEQQRMEQQRMEQQRMEQQRMEQQRMEQQRIEQQRMEQQRMEQQRMEQQRMEEQSRMEEQRRIEEQKRISGMEMMSQQQQSYNQSQEMSFQQTSQSSHQQSMSYEQSSQYQQSYAQSSQSEIYESTEFESGLKGYKPKGVEMANGDMDHKPAMKMIQNNGIFGGITGDQNSLLEDAQFDSKKHSVRDLVGHFSKVKPKAQIPVQYLPEQKIYNGNQGPSLNYLNSSNESATLPRAASSTKKDFDASRQDYEMKKQMQNNTSTTSSTTAVSNNSQQTNVETRSRSAVSTEKKQMLNSRRQSLKDLLYFDTENNGGSSAAGIIDPSAILRGEKASLWNRCESSHPTPPASVSAAQMYISKPPAQNSYSQTLPRSFKNKSCDSNTSQNLAINQQLSPKTPPVVPIITTQLVDPIPTSSSFPLSSIPESSCSPTAEVSQKESLPEQLSYSAPAVSSTVSQSLESQSLVNSSVVTSSSLQLPNSPEYEAVVHSSNKVFTSTSSLIQQQHSMTTAVIGVVEQIPTNTNTTNFTSNSSVVVGKTPVIESSHETLDHFTTAADDLHPTVSLLSSFPSLNVPRSSASTPLPTTPFPCLDHPGSGGLVSSTVSSFLPPHTPTSMGVAGLNRSRTPILVTTRPSSVIEGRTRHVSKDDIARMMAELNAPLPALVPIPQDIRASPLLFHSRTPGTPTLTGSKM